MIAALYRALSPREGYPVEDKMDKNLVLSDFVFKWERRTVISKISVIKKVKTSDLKTACCAISRSLDREGLL